MPWVPAHDGRTAAELAGAPLTQWVVIGVFGFFAVLSYFGLVAWLIRKRFDPTLFPEERLGGGTLSRFRSGLTVYVGLTLLWSVLLLLAAKLDFEHLPDAPILNHVAGDNITVTYTAKDPAKAQNTISIVPADQAAGKGQ